MKDLQSFITSGSLAFTGVVFEAKRVAQQQELLSLVLGRGLDAVLDPQTRAMAILGGYAKGMDQLPWAKKRRHTLADLATAHQQRQLAEDIARFAITHGFTQVIAPTHLIAGPDDPWLAIGIASANALRSALGRQGAGRVQLHYSLALSYEAFRTPAKRLVVLEQLRRVNADGLVATKLALPDDLKQKADKQAKRLNDLRTTLGPYAKKRRDSSFARHPVTRIARGGTH